MDVRANGKVDAGDTKTGVPHNLNKEEESLTVNIPTMNISRVRPF